MHLTIYVHDFYSQIGHARAMQELLNGLCFEKKATISSIEVVAFTCGDLNEMFSGFTCPKKFTRILFPKLKPFLIKTVYYHAASLFHSFFKGRGRKKIGIGIACLNVDIVNVQFIHEQWKDYFFQSRNLPIHQKIYKKVLFCYFYACERFIYSRDKSIRYIVIAKFLKNFLQCKYDTADDKITVIPSSVNTDEFKLPEGDISEITKKLVIKYPQLKNINFDLPIVLFVGALERKGLPRTLESLKNFSDAQLIVIGQSENPNYKIPPMPYKAVHIPFTKEVSLFYQISDIFIFPTQYEPFGLVILEALVMGLDIYVPIENVGASEIIDPSEGIYLFHQTDRIQIQNIKKISIQEKKDRRLKRLDSLRQHSWSAGSEKFYKLLN